MLRHNESYCKSDFFALNQKDILIFLKLFGTNRTVSVDFDTIFVLQAFSFFSPLFPQLSTFIFDIKMKIVCNEDLLLKTRNNQRLRTAVDSDRK